MGLLQCGICSLRIIRKQAEAVVVVKLAIFKLCSQDRAEERGSCTVMPILDQPQSARTYLVISIDPTDGCRLYVSNTRTQFCGLDETQTHLSLVQRRYTALTKMLPFKLETARRPA